MKIKYLAIIVIIFSLIHINILYLKNKGHYKASFVNICKHSPDIKECPKVYIQDGSVL